MFSISFSSLANYITIPFAVVALKFFTEDANRYVAYQFIDEIFHVKQAQLYCKGIFDQWDPKITTPPGLYYLSYLYTQALSEAGIPIELSSSLNSLRFLNFLGGLMLILLASIIRNKYKSITSIALFSSPLLTLYYSLFYTDVWSSVFVVAAYVSAVCDFPFETNVFNVWFSAVLGLISVTFRQTNIVWNAFILAAAIDQRVKKGSGYTGSFLGDVKVFIKQALKNWYLVVPFAVNFSLFAVFLIKNGGITFGDKENHVAVIHIAQVFYCLVFVVGFTAPLWFSIDFIKDYLHYSFGSPIRVLSSVYALGMIVFAIHSFTVVHPFLLADNRHYAFYIWRHIINRNQFSRYFLAIVYHFAIYTICIMGSYNFDAPIEEKLDDEKEEEEEKITEITEKEDESTDGETQVNHDGTEEVEEVQPAETPTTLSSKVMIAAFLFCVAATVAPSPLFEPRYYIVPLLLWRLMIKPNEQPVIKFSIFQTSNRNLRLISEVLFNLFFTQSLYIIYFGFTIHWDTEDHLQRIIW